MRRVLPLLLALAGLAQADPNAPLTFRLTPAQYHAYRSDPPPPLTLTLHLGNPSARAVTLTCRSVGAPVLRAWLAYQGGVPVNRAADLGAFVPVGNAPTCRAVGQRLRLPPGAAYTYTRALGTPRAGAQTEYGAGWNVSLRPGSGWLSRASTSALVVAGQRPVATPRRAEYLDALRASRASWLTLGHGERLSVTLTDERSRDAFGRELRRRGLNPAAMDLAAAPPVRFAPPSGWPHHAAVSAVREGGTFRFGLRLTNTARAPLRQGYGACEPVVVSREDTGEVVWQSGNGPCPATLLGLNLQPGETFTLGARWSGRDSLGAPAAPGRYRVRMALRGFGATASFRVP